MDLGVPAARVFVEVNDLDRFTRVFHLFGEPMEKPGLTKTVEGSALSWSSTEAGTGKLTLVEAVPGQKVVIGVAFLKPMASQATCTLTLTGTSATWVMEGNHNFVGKAFGLVMNMDKMLGGDIEKGLAALKKAAGA